MADPTCVHTAYDFLKDFQQTFAACMVIGAATIAYRSVLKRIAFDKDVADKARQAARLTLCTRLKLRTRPILDHASSVSDWLEKGLVDVPIHEVEDQMEVWPAAPGELEEAWQHLDAIPVSAVDPLDGLRNNLSRMAYVRATPHKHKENWEKFWKRTIISVAKEIAVHADALIKALDNEVFALRKAAELR